MNLNLRHLHAFHEVARLGSISSAAASVHLTQPALTQAIAGMERQLGAALFVRSTSGMQLTPAGAVCAARFGRALAQLREGVQELSRRSAGGEGPDALLRQISSAQLHALTALVEYRNFTRAARASHVSQPTIHRAARELERRLGAPLFENTSFGVLPTRDAEKLARRAALAFAEIAQARAELGELAGRDSGATVVGAMPLARSYLLPRAILRFSDEHPDHSVSIVEGTYESLLASLQAGQIDFLIGALRELTPGLDIVQEHLFDDALSIVVRAGHPLAGRRRLSSADLLRYPWIAPRAMSPLRAHFNALFVGARGNPPRKPIECNSLIAARALLMESDRMMLASAQQIRYERDAGMLVALPHPRGVVARSIGLTRRRDWRPTRAQARLLELIRA